LYCDEKAELAQVWLTLAAAGFSHRIDRTVMSAKGSQKEYDVADLVALMGC
jgi:hypothetical protein